MASAKRASSSTEGFFQDVPRIPNQFHEDASLKRAMSLCLPPEIIDILSPDLSAFGDRVLSSHVLSLSKDAEYNVPRLETWDSFGHRKDELITSNGWKQLRDIGISEGIVAIPYEGKFKQYSRLYQFFKYHLWSASSALVTCPSAMTDGAAALLKKQLKAADGYDDDRRVAFESAFGRLTSSDPSFAWTSGQWMTERAGGSDVGNTETRAHKLEDDEFLRAIEASDGSRLGPWAIDGFKWFSSATDADMSVILAKTYNETSKSDTLSAFFAPTRRKANASEEKLEATASNGVHPQRLKPKLGTRPLPTAELELKGMRAHLLGEAGKGVKEISTVLNITRIHNAVSAMGGWGRGLAIARAFARVRRVNGRLLIANPAHMRDLAKEHVRYRAYMLFTHFAVALLGAIEHHADSRDFTPFLGVQSVEQAALLLRLLTPVLKANTALAAIDGLRWSMESMGGVGYLENEDPSLNIARLFRDSNILAIWEGTTNVMADDTLRVLRAEEHSGQSAALGALKTWSAGLNASSESRHAVNTNLGDLERILQAMSRASSDHRSTAYHGQDIMRLIDRVATATLLVLEAQQHPKSSVSHKILARWLSQTSGIRGISSSLTVNDVRILVEEDKTIVGEYEASARLRPSPKL